MKMSKLFAVLMISLLCGLFSNTRSVFANDGKKEANTRSLRARRIIAGLENRPNFWRVRTEEIIDLCQNVRKGKAEKIASTPAGLPVYAVFYGNFSEPVPQSNWSAASSSSTWKSYYTRSGLPQTVLFCAGIHGAEAESVAAAVNLIQMMETGKDFRGQSDPELLNLIAQYRLIIIPCVNMDGRAISPDHLRKTSYEDFRKASQGEWPDGSPIQWRESKEYFPLPLNKVSWPGGYPNSEGFNIMHDACPGHVRTAEARALLQLTERWNVDLLLNGHSCETAPFMLPPSALNYPAHVVRGNDLTVKVNEAICAAGLRESASKNPKNGNTFNLNTLATLASGALSLTLECSVSCNYPPKKPYSYTFDQMMAPNFIALKTLLKDGLREPFVDRAKLFK
ncbi:MAG: M14 family zinc carboxypeptidase [Planctomycetia bacterium]|nr:M14 family zinc carboxypeptidase [Planctomycetia bacterium]